MAPFDESWTRADTVVVGGGTSGPAVAGLLAESSSERVLVLEAGPDYGAHDSGRWPADLLDARAMPVSHAWGYDSGALYPERVLPFDRARVIGGCSSHNGCAALWGSRADYDGWGAGGWSTDELLPLFHEVSRRMAVRSGEDLELGPYHRAVLETVEAYGVPRVADLNDLDADIGAGPFSANIRDGIRWNAAFAYLDPARDRPNLAVLGDAIVDRVELRPGGSLRVHAIHDGRALVIEAGRVVLTAGTYGTPAILLRSGIGPRAIWSGWGSTSCSTGPAWAATCTTTRWPSSTSAARRSCRARLPMPRAAASCRRSRRSRSSARPAAGRPSIFTLRPSRPCNRRACWQDGSCSPSPV